MRFIEDVIIYESKTTRVYINQCHAKGKKTKVFAVRKDVDDKCYADYLGAIQWNGAWRQYCFYPETETMWSSGCMKGIITFIDKINKQHKDSLHRRQHTSKPKTI